MMCSISSKDISVAFQEMLRPKNTVSGKTVLQESLCRYLRYLEWC